MRYKVLLMVSLSVTTEVLGGWYDTPNQAEGFYFYGPAKRKIAEPKKESYPSKAKKNLSIAYPYTQQLKTWGRELEERLSQAILQPSSPHLYAYQVAQKEVLARAELFSLQWLYNLYLYPELDHTLRV